MADVAGHVQPVGEGSECGAALINETGKAQGPSCLVRPAVSTRQCRVCSWARRAGGGRYAGTAMSR